MKQTILAVTAAAAMALPLVAQAADLPVKAPLYKAPEMAVYNWTGCYVGINGGGAWTKSDWVSTSGVNAHPRGSNGVIGGHVGCNYQVTSVVFGVEGDITSRVRGKGNWSTPGFTAPYSTSAIATVRGRVGIAFNNFLIYGTGGAAFAKWHYRTPECGVGICGAFDSDRVGVVGGGGIEYMFTRNFSARLEGLFYGFGKVRSPAGGVDIVPTDIRTTVSEVRAGLTYHFGGPIVARY